MKKLIILILTIITYIIGCLAFYRYLKDPLNEVKTWIEFFISLVLVIDPTVKYWIDKYTEWLD